MDTDVPSYITIYIHFAPAYNIEYAEAYLHNLNNGYKHDFLPANSNGNLDTFIAVYNTRYRDVCLPRYNTEYRDPTISPSVTSEDACYLLTILAVYSRPYVTVLQPI
jgi:hypothetical protein